MLPLVRTSTLVLLAGLLGLGRSGPFLSAQQPGGPPQPGYGSPTSGGSFRTLPMSAPNYGTNIYAPNQSPATYGPAGGYMAGSANVISSQGQFAIDQQQAIMVREQIKQARIVTRREKLDEQLYERAVKPTAEDDAERDRLLTLRWARNEPPMTAIWSGGALNDLLMGIQRMQAQGVTGPDVPLAPDILPHVNVTGSQAGGNLALLKDGGRLHWPFALTDGKFASDRQALDNLARTAYQQAGSGSVDPGVIRKMTTAANSLQNALRRNVANVDPSDYIAAVHYLNDLNTTITTLQSSDVSNYMTGVWQPKGSTVAQLVAYMTGQGLRFAPALPAGEAAYVALQRAMAAYYPGPNPSKPWDPLAK